MIFRNVENVIFGVAIYLNVFQTAQHVAGVVLSLLSSECINASISDCTSV